MLHSEKKKERTVRSKERISDAEWILRTHIIPFRYYTRLHKVVKTIVSNLISRFNFSAATGLPIKLKINWKWSRERDRSSR